MSTSYYSRAYLLTKVLTASRREVILYLYEGAQNYLNRALKARNNKDEEACAESIERATSIMIELSCCLDYNHNGSLALKLDGIYNYMIEVLTLSNKSREIEPIKTCLSVLTILHDAWQQAIKADEGAESAERHGRLQLSA